MLSVNSALFIHLAIFLVVVFLVGPLLIKPTMALLEERDEKIKGAKDKARSLKEEASARVSDMEEKLAAARKSAVKEREGLRLTYAKKADEITAKAKQISLDQIAAMRQRIAGERESARSALRAEAEAISRDIAKRILGRDVA